MKNIMQKLHRFLLNPSAYIKCWRRQYSVYKRKNWLKKQRKKLRNTDFSLISSNCNGGVLLSDLGLEFKSPFVNLFMTAPDYAKLLNDLKGYMSAKLRFVKEEDPILGDASYPTAYLKDVKIYFMHYASEKEALDAWERRSQRINWNNLYVIFTDRDGCTQEILEKFDRLPFEHKVVFTHVPHPEIKSSFYIKGYEEEETVPVLSDFANVNRPTKRIYERFNFVKWLNEGAR